MLPEHGRARRHQRFRDVHDLANERLWLRAKRQLDAAGRAEKICDDPVTAALHALEKQRRAATRDDAAMDFGQFKIGVNFRVDADEIILARQQVEK
jgi:hypothetical protein